MRKCIGVIILFLLLVFPINILAANKVVISGAGNSGDIDAIQETVENINEELIYENLISEKNIGVIVEENDEILTLSVDKEVYRRLSQTEKEKFLRICFEAIDNSTISHINKVKVYNFFKDSDASIAGLVYNLSEDVKVDIPSAKFLLEPFQSPLGILIGIITVLIFAILGLCMVLDISYITIPAIQLMIQDKTDPNNKRPIIISLEAWDAVKIAEINKSTALSIYFKNKVGQLLVLGICALYLASGNIYSLVSYIVDHLQGFADLLLK